ncbi:hypothetical protein P153DRAFT_352573 [Dothidotthia symphoricarpi CBS 119687]|uniref:Uncharacterized protein n=1 Tax=Dothidotthia symphoricarpi CBS 119687 TaxID=1392245 RepID=A0A6A6ARP5_9PLEO|nr:uncharacterized protein P153DRAFT_352573 [Dothidotthia symphoricarpi CBS 119687]KAF2134599.1 hypothetical protein P153DRAFT_352573 [Dothidotthia symphoricarpi CBS 119687]
MALSNRKRSSSNSLEPSSSSNRPQKRQATKSRNTKKRRNDEINTDQVTSENKSGVFKTPKNPYATLGGLPSELRLRIYHYLSDSTIIHVHRHNATDDTNARYTWTPCRLPNPTCPLLCANPKWSGMCAEEDRCTYKFQSPPEPRGFWAMAESCKFIRDETQEFFIRDNVISIHPENLPGWLNHLARHNPKQIEHLRRVTLAGSNDQGHLSHQCLGLLRDRVPNLEGVGVQSKQPFWRWILPAVSRYDDENIRVKVDAWRNWNTIQDIYNFKPAVTIALEATVWRKYHAGTPNIKEQQFTVGIIRAGTDSKDESASGGTLPWTDEDVQIEVKLSGDLFAAKRNAGWRQWWRGKELHGFM